MKKSKLINTWVTIEGKRFDVRWVPVGRAQCLFLGSSVYHIEPIVGKRGYTMTLYVNGGPIKVWKYLKKHQAFFHGTLLYGLRMHHREHSLRN